MCSGAKLLRPHHQHAVHVSRFPKTANPKSLLQQKPNVYLNVASEHRLVSPPPGCGTWLPASDKHQGMEGGQRRREMDIARDRETDRVMGERNRARGLGSGLKSSDVVSTHLSQALFLNE